MCVPNPAPIGPMLEFPIPPPYPPIPPPDREKERQQTDTKCVCVCARTHLPSPPNESPKDLFMPISLRPKSRSIIPIPDLYISNTHTSKEAAEIQKETERRGGCTCVRDREKETYLPSCPWVSCLSLQIHPIQLHPSHQILHPFLPPHTQSVKVLT